MPATQTVVTPPTTTALQATSGSETERVFWESIKESRNAADFEAYLKKYPKGDFRALAENRLHILQRSSSTAQSGLEAVSPPTSPQFPSTQAKRVTASGQNGDVLYKWVGDNPRDLRVE